MIVRRIGNQDWIDAPITCAIEARWGGGEVVKSEDPGRVTEVGIENLRAIAEFDPTRRTTEYGNMDRPNYVAEEYYADEDHGHLESLDRHVTPRSLYLAQLRDRMGEAAVWQIATTSQLTS